MIRIKIEHFPIKIRRNDDVHVTIVVLLHFIKSDPP